MDGGRFDDLTRRLAVLNTRRASLRAIAGIALASGVTWRKPVAAAFCRAAGNRCKEDSDCCSFECKKTKGKKKKNGKRKKGKKACLGNGLFIPGCVGLWGDCDGPDECCGSLVCLNDMNKCCAPSGAPCSSAAQCCNYGGLDVVCEADGGSPRCCRPEGVYCYQDGQCCSGHCDSLACAP